MRLPRTACPLLVLSLAAHGQEPALTLEEVVVKGKGRATETEQRQQANVAKIVIPRQELERSGDLSVSDYLKKLPGLGPVGNKGGNIAAGAPQILIDGVPVAGGRTRNMALSRIALDMVEKIEVTRSPTAALANESAGAVVNIVLKNTVQQALRAGLNLGVGEHASRLGGGINGQVGAREDDFSWVVVASYYQRGNLSSVESETRSFDTAGALTDRTRESSDGRGESRNLNLTPKLTWQLNATDRLLVEPSLSYSRNPLENERLLFDYPNTFTGSVAEDSDSTQSTYRLRGEWLRKDGQAERTLRASLQRGIEEDSKHTLDSVAGSSSEKGEARDWAIDLATQMKQPFAPGHLFTAGVEYAWRRLDESKDLAANGVPVMGSAANAFDIREHSWVAYAQDEWALNDKMSLTPGLRFRHIERDSEDGAGATAGASSSTFSPSLHTLWKAAEQLNLRASASHILKPPTFSDLTTLITTRDGTQTRPDQSGNPNLKNETAWVYNIGLEHYLSDKAGVLGVNFFYRDLSDLIQRRTLLEGARYVSRPVNIGDAAIWGVELDARAKMSMIGLPDLTLRGNFVTQNSRAKDDTSGETGRVGDLPAYSANLGADYEFVEQKLNLSVNLRLAGKQNMGVGDLESLDPQQFLSANLTKKLSKTLTLRAGGHNLLNQQSDRTALSYHPAPDEDRLASWQHAVETATRSFYVSLESVW
jgi:iron complex outermembrane receptor protein